MLTQSFISTDDDPFSSAIHAIIATLCAISKCWNMGHVWREGCHASHALNYYCHMIKICQEAMVGNHFNENLLCAIGYDL